MADTATVGAFGVLAIPMRVAGWAPVPTVGKKPALRGYNKAAHRPSLATVQRLCSRHGDKDVGFVPGQSRNKRGAPLVVLDCDDEEAAGLLSEACGDTPGRWRGARAGSYLYVQPKGLDLSGISSLRKYGFNADIKHGRSLVIAPGSLHPSGVMYRWADGVDERVIDDVPPLPVEALRYITSRRPKPGTAPAEPQTRDGSRGLGLNDYLCSQATYCDTYDELLDVARTYAERFPEIGIEALSEDKIVQRVNAVWSDVLTGKITPMFRRRGVARMGGDEIKAVAALGRHGGDAFMLLALLRVEHTARVARGETFAIAARAMAKTGTLPGWTEERFENARDTLIAGEFIRCVSQFRNGRSGRSAAQYTFVDRSPVPRGKSSH